MGKIQTKLEEKCKEGNRRSLRNPGRSFIRLFFLGNLWILSIGLFALIFAGLLSVSFHVLPAQDASEILGIIFIGWLCFMQAFYCTKTGNKFIVDVGIKIEKSVKDTLQALQVFPVLPSLEVVKFIHSNEAADSFIPSSPFIPPRQRLA